MCDDINASFQQSLEFLSIKTKKTVQNKNMYIYIIIGSCEMCFSLQNVNIAYWCSDESGCIATCWGYLSDCQLVTIFWFIDDVWTYILHLLQTRELFLSHERAKTVDSESGYCVRIEHLICPWTVVSTFSKLQNVTLWRFYWVVCWSSSERNIIISSHRM